MDNKQQRTLFLFPVIAVVMIILVLILLFVPDMSTTLTNSIPEYPPEINSVGESDSEEVLQITVTRENVRSVIAALKRPSEYFSETKSILSHTSGSANFSRKRWVKGNLERVDIITSDDKISMHYMYDNSSVYVWNDGSTAVYKTAKGNFNGDDAQMMMSYEDIINASADDVVNASLASYDGISCIYAEVKNSKTGYTEKYWVSTSTGLLIHGETLDANGSLFYSITATSTDISPQSIENFRLPDGSIPTDTQ